MSIYDHRLEAAYRCSGGRQFPLIAKWWTAAHDALVERLIREHHWHWSWWASKEIQKITDAGVLAAWRVEHERTPQNIWYNAIMYHAEYRAAELGLSKLVRTPAKKHCPLCGNEFIEDSVPVPFTTRMGMDRINFCAPCLNGTIGSNAGRTDSSGTEISEYLRRLADAIQRVPSQGFEESTSTFLALTDRERLALLTALRGKPSLHSVKKTFGSWFDALREAGLLTNDSRKLVFGTQCHANDGHLCLSLGEKTIDDLLYANGIPHYPEGKFRADFRVGLTLIEYFGLLGRPGYDVTADSKRRIARRHGIRLIEILPRDLASLKRLEAKLLGGLGSRCAGANAPTAGRSTETRGDA